MLTIIVSVAAAVIIMFIIAATNVNASAPHVDEESDFFLDVYLPLDPDLDGDITDVD